MIGLRSDNQCGAGKTSYNNEKCSQYQCDHTVISWIEYIYVSVYKHIPSWHNLLYCELCKVSQIQS